VERLRAHLETKVLNSAHAMQEWDVRWLCCMPKDAIQGLSPKSPFLRKLECIHVPVKTSHRPSCLSTTLCSGGRVTVPRCKRSSSMTGSTSVSTAALLHATTIVISNMTALLLRKHLPGSLHVSLRFTCLQNCFLWACSVPFNAFLLIGCIITAATAGIQCMHR
jgi:hypothetical protein